MERHLRVLKLSNPEFTMSLLWRMKAPDLLRTPEHQDWCSHFSSLITVDVVFD
jgi:hypothetical protein